ncbi:MAG: hypothetical protein ACOCZ6_04310 [Nanoarchaeota archaeon]
MKKGQVGYLVDIISFFGLIVILVLFSIIFAFLGSSSEFEAHTQLNHYDASMQVMEVLQTPVEIDGYEATYGEFIVLASDDGKLEDKVKEELDLFLEKIYNKTGMSIMIGYEGGIEHSGYGYYSSYSEDKMVSFPHVLPGPGKERVVLDIKVGHKGFEE